MRWARIFSAYSSTVERGSVGEFKANKRIALSAGLTFRYEGGLGMLGGRSLRVRAIIDCTSWAAASISRLKLNWSVIWVRPRVLVELMESTPAIVENCFSRGVATVVAMVSGLAPGRLALTTMVGKSTVGSSLTGRARYPMSPKMMMAIITRVVMMGRRIKISAIFILRSSSGLRVVSASVER